MAPSSAQPPFGPGLRLSASQRFYQIVNHFDVSGGSSNNSRSDRGYDRIKLVRLTYEYARSEESKANFLRAFFQSAALPMDEDEAFDLSDEDLEAELRTSLFNFAEYLLDNFFLPVMASAKKTPQHTPATHSAIQEILSEGYDFSGTPERLSALRGTCLVRDRYHCVISREFDRGEARERLKRYGRQEARDDDGFLLAPSKQAVLAILNMIDSGAAFLVEGTNIDRPHNAITLTSSLHELFGEFQVFFEPIDQRAHTYRIDTFLEPELVGGLLPITRTLHFTETQGIDPPSPRLLAIHSAIAYVLHLSGAGDYIERILRDIEEYGIREDGSTELGRLVNLRLNG
ncbi:hypothetical protein N0V84_010675 [Fusarium piperis]|uniref:HNH nuclease domain-containing protein n=1 Tax=Fusarium piperis TaxID=1435070 RepID=A0A9W8TF02_9HYPO|nr:hypothetical protein N0V84_010675 [Fusarium piperis]